MAYGWYLITERRGRGAYWGGALNRKNAVPYSPTFAGYCDPTLLAYLWCFHGNDSILLAWNTWKIRISKLAKWQCMNTGSRSNAITSDKNHPMWTSLEIFSDASDLYPSWLTSLIFLYLVRSINWRNRSSPTCQWWISINWREICINEYYTHIDNTVCILATSNKSNFGSLSWFLPKVVYLSMVLNHQAAHTEQCEQPDDWLKFSSFH